MIGRVMIQDTGAIRSYRRAGSRISGANECTYPRAGRTTDNLLPRMIGTCGSTPILARSASRFGQTLQALRTRSVAGWSLGKMIHSHLMPRSSTNPGVSWTPKLSWPRQSAASHGDTRCNGRPGHLRRCLQGAARCRRFPSLFRTDRRRLRYSRALTNAQTMTLNQPTVKIQCVTRIAATHKWEQ